MKSVELYHFRQWATFQRKEMLTARKQNRSWSDYQRKRISAANEEGTLKETSNFFCELNSKPEKMSAALWRN